MAQPRFRIDVVAFLHQNKIYFALAFIVGIRFSDHLAGFYFITALHIRRCKIAINSEILSMLYKDCLLVINVTYQGYFTVKYRLHGLSYFSSDRNAGIIIINATGILIRPKM